MIKVFLVEDEIIMREGIKNNINWEQEGFEFAGEASDGELAYPLIQKVKPDILITDIKMPFMDGLELSRLVKQELPDVKIIILSGYDEFEFAKEAISIGITDYLVKPVSGGKLLEAVKKVGKMIQEEQEQKRFLQIFEKERLENKRLEKQKFFRMLALGKASVSTLLTEGRKIGLELSAKRYNILLFQIFPGGEIEGYSEEQNMVTVNIMSMTDDMPEVLMIELGIEGWIFIFKETEEKKLDDTLQIFVDKLKEVLSKYPDMEYFGGVGTTVERLSELKQCYEAASHAFAYRYLMPRNQIIYSDAMKDKSQAKNSLNLSALEVKKLDRRITERFLKTGLKSEVTHFIDEYFQSFGEQNIQSLLFRQYITMDMYFAAVSQMEEIGFGADELLKRCGDFQEMTGVFASTVRTKQYLRKVLETTIDLRETASNKKYHSLLEDARNYIGENYDNKDISLNMVSASVNLSPNHFSTIFSQETGKTFIEYLTFVRMEKAKELLRSTSMKTAEIAYAVGYKDPHYFSYLFKKTQECTPREFRNQV